VRNGACFLTSFSKEEEESNNDPGAMNSVKRPRDPGSASVRSTFKLSSKHQLTSNVKCLPSSPICVVYITTAECDFLKRRTREE
jgi:hypothetical protein